MDPEQESEATNQQQEVPASPVQAEPSQDEPMVLVPKTELERLRSMFVAALSVMDGYKEHLELLDKLVDSARQGGQSEPLGSEPEPIQEIPSEDVAPVEEGALPTPPPSDAAEEAELALASDSGDNESEPSAINTIESMVEADAASTPTDESIVQEILTPGPEPNSSIRPIRPPPPIRQPGERAKVFGYALGANDLITLAQEYNIQHDDQNMLLPIHLQWLLQVPEYMTSFIIYPKTNEYTYVAGIASNVDEHWRARAYDLKYREKLDSVLKCIGAGETRHPHWYRLAPC